MSWQFSNKKELEPALQELQKLSVDMGHPDNILADTGYYSAANIQLCLDHNIYPLIAQKREKHHPSPCERFSEPAPLYEEATDVERVFHHLKAQEGKNLYAKRESTVEPVFGIMKSVMGFRQFMLRGIETVKGEWNLLALC